VQHCRIFGDSWCFRPSFEWVMVMHIWKDLILIVRCSLSLIFFFFFVSPSLRYWSICLNQNLLLLHD
jgi:hypothetical protein